MGGSDLSTLRIGAAEYALLVEDATAARIEALAARLGEALARPFVVQGVTAALGSRLGIALADPGDDAAALMQRATKALTRAKASDGATMHVADAGGAGSIDSLAIDLHHAIDRDEIDILFQPQVEIASGRITGVEALARWEHGGLGVLGAEALFAAADRADLGIALSEHIQGLVLTRAARWPDALAGLRVSVNLTAADVARPGYAALFLARLDASGFPRGRLTIEVTESGLMEDLTAASAFLAALRGAGCRVAIDDFGTGYSSLAYLKTLPLDYLKIDRALTRDIGGSARDRVVVGGVITMARSLGLGVIAEGVETTDQRDLLAAAGCDLYQGFLTAPPLDETALVAMMARGSEDALDAIAHRGPLDRRGACRRGADRDPGGNDRQRRGVEHGRSRPVHARSTRPTRPMSRPRGWSAARQPSPTGIGPASPSGGNARGRLTFADTSFRTIDRSHELMWATMDPPARRSPRDAASTGLNDPGLRAATGWMENHLRP